MTELGPGEEGQTPLTPDQLDQLIPDHVQNRADLDMLEARNIADAVAWLARSRRRDPMSVKTMRELHRRMFRDVWRWAGQFSREFNRRLGADANQIEPELVKLVDDALTWIETGSIDDPCELLAAFHHRLTRIHPFPNGNGRWARLMTNLLAEGIGHPPVNWAPHSAAQCLGRRSTRREQSHGAPISTPCAPPTGTTCGPSLS